MVTDPRLGLFAAACVAGGLFAFFWGLRCYQRKRLIQNTPTSKVEAAAIGPVELSGRAVPHEAMQGPIEQLPCVYWRYKVEELRPSGKSSHWVTIDSGEARVPFYIEDDTGKMLVDPKRATIDIPKDLREETARLGFGRGFSPCTVTFAEQRGIELDGFFTRSKRFTEWMIAPGDPLFVFGTVAAVENQLAGRTKMEDRVVRWDRTNRFFLIADRSARAVVDEFEGKAFLGVLGAGVVAVAGLAILLRWLGYQ